MTAPALTSNALRRIASGETPAVTLQILASYPIDAPTSFFPEFVLYLCMNASCGLIACRVVTDATLSALLNSTAFSTVASRAGISPFPAGAVIDLQARTYTYEPQSVCLSFFPAT
jgi:hypothetical protein